jgi:hypothetical protein
MKIGLIPNAIEQSQFEISRFDSEQGFEMEQRYLPVPQPCLYVHLQKRPHFTFKMSKGSSSDSDSAISFTFLKCIESPFKPHRELQWFRDHGPIHGVVDFV